MATCTNCARLQVEELAAKFQSEFLGDPGLFVAARLTA
jgi:hypothetical protein